PGNDPTGAGAGCLDLKLAAVTGPQGVEVARLVDAVVGVCTEEVTLALDDGGRQTLGTQGVGVGQGGVQHRCRQTQLRDVDDTPAPRVHQGRGLTLEGGVEQQAGQLGIVVVGLNDAVEELRADDAATAPDGGEAAG